MTRTIGRTSSSSPAISSTDRLMNSVAVLPMERAARFSRPPPTACPMDTVEPIARPTIITVSMCITWLPIDTAVVLATPSNWPTMNKSAMPYSVWRK